MLPTLSATPTCTRGRARTRRVSSPASWVTRPVLSSRASVMQYVMHHVMHHVMHCVMHHGMHHVMHHVMHQVMHHVTHYVMHYVMQLRHPEPGAGVTSVVVGDHVVPCYTPQCNEAACVFCRSPKTNLCPTIRGTQGKGLMPDGAPSAARTMRLADQSTLLLPSRPAPPSAHAECGSNHRLSE